MTLLQKVSMTGRSFKQWPVGFQEMVIFKVTYIIQIWTCDEGNVEIYGSQATILTEAKPRSILLPKIYKAHITQHLMLIFALLYVKCLWFKHICLWIHLLLVFIIIPNLQSRAGCYHCYITLY